MAGQVIECTSCKNRIQVPLLGIALKAPQFLKEDIWPPPSMRPLTQKADTVTATRPNHLSKILSVSVIVAVMAGCFAAYNFWNEQHSKSAAQHAEEVAKRFELAAQHAEAATKQAAADANLAASISRAKGGKIPELKTASGETYRDVRITNVTPSDISIIHESGATRIPIAKLTEEFKTKLGYDPEKAAEFKRKENAKELQNEVAVAKSEAAANQAAAYKKRLQLHQERAPNSERQSATLGGAAQGINTFFGRSANWK